MYSSLWTRNSKRLLSVHPPHPPSLTSLGSDQIRARGAAGTWGWGAEGRLTERLAWGTALLKKGNLQASEGSLTRAPASQDARSREGRRLQDTCPDFRGPRQLLHLVCSRRLCKINSAITVPKLLRFGGNLLAWASQSGPFGHSPPNADPS